MSTTYQSITQSAAQAIVGRYQSIPGGVTLEGNSPDLSFIKTVAYVKSANAFILNDDVVYLSSVNPDELSQINSALATDDKMGVSLGGENGAIIYGALPPHGSVALNLKLTDKFLGAVAFGNPIVLWGYKSAPGYREGSAFSNLAVYFNFHDFRFSEESSGELKTVAHCARHNPCSTIVKQSKKRRFFARR